MRGTHRCETSVMEATDLAATLPPVFGVFSVVMGSGI